MKTAVIIPARYKSSRFPGKPLANILGKPMIIWVAEICTKAVGRDNVYVATDSNLIQETVVAFGFNSIITSKYCLTGTDRLAEAAKKIQADVYVNVQGDEPLIDPNDIKVIIQKKEENFNAVINGYCELNSTESPNDINLPKVVFNEKKELVYISRSAIPGVKNIHSSRPIYYKQVCIYAFNHEELEAFKSYSRKSDIEDIEDIEILRFLELGKKILMVKTNKASLSVDVKEDINKVEEALKQQGKNVPR